MKPIKCWDCACLGKCKEYGEKCDKFEPYNYTKDDVSIIKKQGCSAIGYNVRQMADFIKVPYSTLRACMVKDLPYVIDMINNITHESYIYDRVGKTSRKLFVLQESL